MNCVQEVERHLDTIQVKLATLTKIPQENNDGCFPGVNNKPWIQYATCIHELSLLIQELKMINVTQGTTMSKREVHLAQLNSQMNKAISLFSAANGQSARANARLKKIKSTPT